jgi:hypothetical protein
MSEEIVEACYPMTPTQQGIMFQSDFGTKSGYFHVQVVLDIDQDLQVEAFRQSWVHVMERHAALRTRFRDLQTQNPQQAVCERVDVPFIAEDWRGLSAEEQQGRLRSYQQMDLDRGFPLHEAPLWRLHVARLDEASFCVVWSLHYILLDGQSQAIILSEVESYYGHLTAQRPLTLQPATAFQDYVHWLSRQDIVRAERFWRTELESVEPATPLPSQRKAPAGAGSDAEVFLAAYDQIRLLLDEEETEQLSAAAEQHGISIETMIQGCWALLLSRYTGAGEVVVGVAAPGRSGDLPGIERMAGLLINTLPLRVRVPGSMSWVDWMHSLQLRYVQIQQYGYSPLLEINGGAGSARATHCSRTFSRWNRESSTTPTGLCQ